MVSVRKTNSGAEILISRIDDTREVITAFISALRLAEINCSADYKFDSCVVNVDRCTQKSGDPPTACIQSVGVGCPKDKLFCPSVVEKNVVHYADMVREFHEKFGCIRNTKPTMIPSYMAVGRLRLMTEELGELVTAIDDEDIVEISDALADLLYVVFGTAIAYGIPIDEVFKQVHVSNMSKIGGHMEGGKYIKPDSYIPVDLSWVRSWKPSETGA